MWQTNLTGSTQDLIGMQQQLAKQVRSGLLPMLGAAGGFLETSTRPNNQEAYDLYLRSVAVPHDSAPNREAIRIAGTRRGIGSRSTPPPGRSSALRYYYDATYSNGGEQMFQHSNAAFERALTLDPNRMVAAGPTHCQPGGAGRSLGKAYQSALELW